MEGIAVNEDFAGQVAVVTGAGRGLGRAYALWLAKAGVKVVVNNRARAGRTSVAEAVAREIRDGGGIAIANEDRIEDPAGAARLVAAALGAFDRLDILVCNAGITTFMLLDEMSAEDFQQIMSVNFYGSLYPIQAALKPMYAAGYGRIVATASTAAWYPIPGVSAYAASKSALIGLVRTLGTEAGDRNVRINLIAPMAYTPMSYGHMDENLADLFSTDHIAPVVGWLSAPSCDRSGGILTIGGGEVRRVGIVEGPGQRIEPDMADFWARLESLEGGKERATGMETADSLIAAFRVSQRG